MKKGGCKILALLSALQFLCSCGENKVAGTSTNTENTLAGTIVYNGKGLANVRVALRRSAALPNAKTEIKNEAVTDSLGHFSLKVAAGLNYTLYAKIITINNDTVVCYKTNIDLPANTPSVNLDTLTSKHASQIKGVIVSSAPKLIQLFIGMQGTDKFVEVDSTGHFEIDELADGKNQLMVFSAESEQSRYLLEDVELRSGKKLTLDTILLPQNWEQSLQKLSNPLACQEPLEKIDEGVPRLDIKSDSMRMLYTIFPGSIPKLVEIDLCKGVWYPKMDLLPGLAHFVQLFQFNSLVYAFDGDRQVIQRINLVSKQVDTVSYPFHLASVANNRNQIIATFHNDSWLHIFDSFDHFLKNISQDSIPTPKVLIQQMSLNNDTALFLGSGFLSKYALKTHILDSTFHPTLPKKIWNGVSKGANGKIFLLGSQNQLFYLNPQNPVIVDTVSIFSDSAFTGLVSPLF